MTWGVGDGSNPVTALKGIETAILPKSIAVVPGSNPVTALKGIETDFVRTPDVRTRVCSNPVTALKGIETVVLAG